MRAQGVRPLATILALAIPACGCPGGAGDDPCTFTVAEDGSRQMICSDDTLDVPPPSVSPRTGVVSGSASRFGDPDRSEIEIWLLLAPNAPGEDRESRHALSDDEGSFRFDDVPPGVHEILFSSAGFVGEVRPVVVSPGEFVLDPVVLRRGLASLACERTALFPSPRRDAFLVRYGDRPAQQRLVYWEPGGAGMVPLGERVSSARGSEYFSADGRLIHFLEEASGGEEGAVLNRFKIGAPGALPIAAGVESWYPALGGDALIVSTRSGLKAWDPRFAGPDGSGALRAIAGEPPSELFLGPDGRLVSFVIGGLLVVWDMREMTGDSLGPFRERPVFSPDGGVLVAGFGDELLAWDADRQRRVRLGPGLARDVRFHESGRRLVYLEAEGSSKRLVHVDLDGGAMPVIVGDRVEEAFYGPGDDGIAWIEVVAGERVLVRAEGSGATPEVVGSGLEISHVTFSVDGRRLFFVVYDPESNAYRLDIHEPGLGTHGFAPVFGGPILEPDGDGVFFYQPMSEDGAVGLRYWDPITDEVFHIHDSVRWIDQGFEALVGPDSRLLFADSGGTWHRWDPSAAATVTLGPGPPYAVPDFRFLADGAVAFAGYTGLLRLLEPDGTAPRTVGTGLAANGLFGPSGDGKRFSYLYGSRFPTLVLFDRALDRAISLDDGVATAVQGDAFVAYVRDLPAAENGSQRLYLVTYPVEAR